MKPGDPNASFGPHGRVQIQYRVNVPAGLVTSFRTENGAIRIENVEGRITAASTNGPVVGRGLSGSVDASTVNGGIEIGLASLDADSRIEGKVVVMPGAIIERSTVRGPAVIGAGARIIQAYVGPFTAIGDRAEIRETEIEHSIVLEEARITNLAHRIEDSLIGRNVEIGRSPIKPKAYKMILGDHSKVGVL